MNANAMRYRHLGSSGLLVSEIALGTQTFGWGADEKTAHALADLYAGAGGNFFDTANIYNAGVSETMLGNWLRASGTRHEKVVASKVFFRTGDGPNDWGLSRTHILRSVDESLGRLRTDYIDLYQLHCFDRSTPLEETLETLDDLVRLGKVRYLGLSNFTPSQIVKVRMLCAARGRSSFASLQAEYSLIVREAEWELLPVCAEEGLGFLAWSPLAGGWLSGKYRHGAPPPGESRAGRGDRWDDLPAQRESELAWRVIETVRDASEALGKTPAQVALGWLLSRPGVTAPIIGARTAAQLEENLGGAGWSLPEEWGKKLEEASAVPLPYPYRFIERYTKRRESGG
jgi:aryl-alcohol dehydrogenase-like predicted oxidoreductase